MMDKRVKMILNMGESIAKINGWTIARADLHREIIGSITYYVLFMEYDVDGVIKAVTIRSDFTIVGYDD